ncbi:MAG: efflux RND transporter periplasmic adaptor subunit [Candidatus Binatia bacterium]
MRRSLWIIAFLIAVGGFAVFQQYSSWSLNKPQSDSATNPEAGSVRSAGRGQARGGGRGREAVPVVVVTAVQKAVPVQIRAVGNVEAYSTVAVKSQVTGVLQQAHFKEGQDVKKGQLLFTIDPRPFEAALKQSEANLARDTAQLRNLREQVRRYAELVEKQYVSREQYDQIKTNADAAEAVVEADNAAVENAKVQLSYCYIYSPIDGRVGSLLVNEGNLVRVNDGAPLVVINQVNPINVTFAVPEQHMVDLRRHIGAAKLQVDAAFPSDDGRPERGKLEFVDNAVDRATGTIKLKGVFTNSERRLWPGQFVNVALTLTTQADAVVIPSEAIQVGQEGQHVFVVKEDNRVEMRPVTLGQTNEGEAIVAKGLAAGEQVVREGQFLLGPGSRIEVKSAANVSGDTPGERRRGRGKADGAGTDALKAGDPTKAEAKGGRQTKRDGAARVKGDKQGRS